MNAQPLMLRGSGILMLDRLAHSAPLCEFLADTSDKHKTLLSDKSPAESDQARIWPELARTHFLIKLQLSEK